MDRAAYIAACFVMGLLALSSARAGNETWAKDAPIAKLSGDDLKIAMATLNKSLDSGRDGEASAWSNPATRSSGSITPGAAFERQGLRCRSAKLTISAKGQNSSSDWNLCRTPEGWKFAEGR